MSNYPNNMFCLNKFITSLIIISPPALVFGQARPNAVYLKLIKPTIFSIFVLFSFVASAQVAAPSQNPEEMIRQLKTAKHDTLKVKTLQSLLQYFVIKRGYLTVNLDSALDYGNQAKSLADSLHRSDLKDLTLMWMGEAYLKYLDYEKGKAYYLEAIDDYHAAKQRKKEVRALLILSAKAMYYKLTRSELLNFSRRALALANQSGDLPGIMNAHMITGALFEKIGQLDSAGVHLLKALPIAKTAGGEDAFKVYIALSYFYRDKGDDASALLYSSAALKDLQDRHVSEKSPKYAAITLDMASAYEAFDRKQAIIYYKAAMKYALINKAEAGMDQYYFALEGLVNQMCFNYEAKKALFLANGYIQLYPPISDFEKAKVAVLYANIYKTLAENKLAEKNFLKAIYLYKNDPGNQSGTKAALARFYSDTKQFKKTEVYLKDNSPEKKSLPFMNGIWEEHQKYQIDSAKGDYIGALDHYRRYKAMNDTYYTKDKAKQIAGLEIKYQTKEKEQSIKLLKSESASQRADLQRINLQKNITLGGIGILLLVSCLVIYGYSQIQRSNSLLMVQKNEINKKNESLEKLSIIQQNLLMEKEWLLKEVHHRVKNNLQIVMSLLSSQSAYLENTAAIEAIRESQNRVQAISLIHQELYKSTNVASINMPAYVADLLEYLADCFDTRKRHIRFEQLIESFNLDLAQAVPIGLILNESVTNAIKYAFGAIGGQIIVVLQLIKDETLLLTIADDGKGLPANFDIQNSTTLGMEMMKALSKQLGGEFKIENKDGVRLSIEFQIETALMDLPEKIYSRS